LLSPIVRLLFVGVLAEHLQVVGTETTQLISQKRACLERCFKVNIFWATSVVWESLKLSLVGLAWVDVTHFEEVDSRASLNGAIFNGESLSQVSHKAPGDTVKNAQTSS